MDKLINGGINFKTFLQVSVFVLIDSFIVYYFWNDVIPYLFGLPEIKWWQALELMVLCCILFGGIPKYTLKSR